LLTKNGVGMNVKIIKDEKDYQVAMARLSELMKSDPKRETAEENELELLALVIEKYEKLNVPPIKADPIELILFRMQQMKLKRKDMIAYFGSPSKVSEVLTRKRPLSLSMIRKLHQGLGIPSDILIEDIELNSTGAHNEFEIDFSRFPLKELSERGYFGNFDGNSSDLLEYAEDLIKKFMKGFVSKQTDLALFRAPIHQRGDRSANEMSLLAWRICVLKKASKEIPSKVYKEGSITRSWLRELAKLSAFSNGPLLAKEYLSRYGVTLIIERHFKRTFLDGAAMLFNDRPIVALTLRHDRIDNFWFALLHEMAHVAKHLNSTNPLFIDDLDLTNHESIEAEADEMAREALIPNKTWETAKVRHSLSWIDATELADNIGVHPAIVAGRLRHEMNNFQLLSGLIGKSGSVSSILLN